MWGVISEFAVKSTSPPMASSLAPAVGRPPSASCSCAAAPSFSSPLASPRGAAVAAAGAVAGAAAVDVAAAVAVTSAIAVADLHA